MAAFIALIVLVTLGNMNPDAAPQDPFVDSVISINDSAGSAE